jgi:hypothetical protein
MSGSMVLIAGAATAEPSAGPIRWPTAGAPPVVVGAAIVDATRRTSRLQRWHDDATLVDELGAQVGEAVRVRLLTATSSWPAARFALPSAV